MFNNCAQISIKYVNLFQRCIYHIKKNFSDDYDDYDYDYDDDDDDNLYVLFKIYSSHFIEDMFLYLLL